MLRRRVSGVARMPLTGEKACGNAFLVLISRCSVWREEFLLVVTGIIAGSVTRTKSYTPICSVL